MMGTLTSNTPLSRKYAKAFDFGAWLKEGKGFREFCGVKVRPRVVEWQSQIISLNQSCLTNFRGLRG